MTTTPEKNVNFMKLALPMGILSIVLVLASVVLLATRGLNLGLDFTGGTVVEVAAPQDIALNDLRDALAEGGYADAIVQHFGSSRDVVVRVPPHETDNGDEVGLAVFEMVSSAVPSLELRRVEFVGPQVGDELRDQSGLAVLFAMGAMLLYIWFRFTNKFGVAALLALVHDVIVVLGAFALFRWQFDLTVLAAVLAVVGYSINDTIVIADHIREDFRTSRQSDTRAIINHSITRTLSRTMITSATTMLVLIALYVFGGEMISGFAMTLIIGVLVGTYSSVYVANGLLLLMKVDKEDFIVPERTEVDEMP
jgi:preprotein translocase subunit SecF